MKYLITILLFAMSSQNVFANTKCTATCYIYGEIFQFSFNRIDASTYRAGMERCLRLNGQTAIINVSEGSPTEMACFTTFNRSEAVEIEDLGEWLAKNELQKQCEDKYSSGDWRAHNYTRGQQKNVSCQRIEP